MERNKRKCYGLLLALFIMLGLSLSVFSEDSSAVSDVSFNIYKGDNGLILCYNNNSSYSPYNCSDYSYLVISSPTFLNSTVNSRFYFGTHQVYSTVFGISDPFYLPISDSRYIQFDGFPLNSNSVSSSDYFVATLTNSLGSCPEIEPCPVIPEYPYEDDLASIKNAILLCGGVILFIYFFYAIYKPPKIIL